MMKKLSFKFLLVFITVIFSFSIVSFAEEDIILEDILTVSPDISSSDEGDIANNDSEPEPSTQSTPSLTTSGNDCLCGREYYTEDTKEHSKYDCIKCGKNMYACTCNCWCGATSILDTTGAYGSISPRVCSGCGKPCPDCDCRDNKEEILTAEKLRINGEISPLNLPRPENGVNLFFALFTILLFTCAAVFLPNAPFMKKNGDDSVEEIDLNEVFAELEDSEEENASEEKISEAENSAVVQTKTADYGISISEKINLPWITSKNSMIDINAAMAKVIFNGKEVVCGDSISINELSEQLMSKKTDVQSREARFPEFFGVMPENDENDAKGENS